MGKVVICETLLKPQEIPVPSSMGDGSYYMVVARTIFNDPVCDCKGFQFRGTCKHITLVDSARCGYYRPAQKLDIDSDGDGNVGRCPSCRSALILYELDPEFE